MPQCITTKFLAPTNSRGARVAARCQAKRIVVSWNDSLDVEANHRCAAMALVSFLSWPDAERWVGGSLPDDTGYAFVMTPARGR